MSSTTQSQFRQDAVRAVSQIEPQVEQEISRERVEIIVNQYPEHDVARLHQKIMRDAAQKRAAHKAVIDKLVTIERCILIMDATGAFGV